MENLDPFTRAYIKAALWSSMDDDGNPLDSYYSESDLTADTLDKIKADCAKFQEENSATLESATCNRGSGEYSSNRASEQAGHDFWLTRNCHGCGFRDGDWSEPEATLLTEASDKFGECDIYVTDDGELAI